MEVALLVKYTQPKGAGGPTYRFPPAAIDVSQFAYRLPYAALDASQITLPARPISSRPDPGGGVSVMAQVRDWDSGAGEAPGATVGDQSDVSLIQSGAAGAPSGRFDAPALSDQTWNVTPPAAATGEPGDELVYTRLFSNALGTASAGTVYGVLEMGGSAEVGGITDDYHYGLDADTLVADLGRALVARHLPGGAV